MKQEQGVLQTCRRIKINPDTCTCGCRTTKVSVAVAGEVECGWWEQEKQLVQRKLLKLDAFQFKIF